MGGSSSAIPPPPGIDLPVHARETITKKPLSMGQEVAPEKASKKGKSKGKPKEGEGEGKKPQISKISKWHSALDQNFIKLR